MATKSEKRKTPYSQLREAAAQNAKTKHSTASVHIRLGVMCLGIVIAMAVYFYPTLVENTLKNQGIYKSFFFYMKLIKTTSFLY